MSQSQLPPPVVHPVPQTTGTVGEVAGMVKKLDPNMLAVLMLTVALNGMFFYVYVEVARTRHTEFMAALTSCTISPNNVRLP